MIINDNGIIESNPAYLSASLGSLCPSHAVIGSVALARTKRTEKYVNMLCYVCRAASRDAGCRAGVSAGRYVRCKYSRVIVIIIDFTCRHNVF